MVRKGAGRRSPALSMLDDPDYMAEIIERYQDGESTADIAEDIGVNISWLGVKMRAAGCQMRPTGGAMVRRSGQGAEVSAVIRANLGGVIQQLPDIPAVPDRSRQRKPIDETTLRNLAERYRGGMTIRALVSDTGWAYGTVHRRLQMAERQGLMIMRPKGGARVDPSARRGA